jgi:hypothetical protein
MLVLTGQSPLLGWLTHQHIKLSKKVGDMRLSLDPVKDVDLIKARLQDVVPEGSEDVTALLRVLVDDFMSSKGVNKADVIAALNTLVSELENQVIAAV